MRNASQEITPNENPMREIPTVSLPLPLPLSKHQSCNEETKQRDGTAGDDVVGLASTA